MDKLVPKLFTVLRTYTKELFIKDLIAGIIVAIIALPLSIALALASGVRPEQGIYTAIIAGFLISFLGGSKVQISGPTAAFATIVAGIVARSGTEGLAVATIMAGILLIIMGFCRFGNLIKFIPYTIITGFTSGIAVTIFIGQVKDFTGIVYINGLKPIETTEKIEVLLHSINTFNGQAFVVGVVCLCILIFWPKVTEKIPASLIAIIVGILMVKGFDMQVNTIGDLYEINNKLPSFSWPNLSLDLVKSMLPDAFTIAILAGIESLLSCVVSDSMINTRHRSNMELIAQGVGNMGSALFGGIPATGAIARTAANIKNGGRTPIAGIVHSITLVLILVILMPYATLIPMPAIAAILFIVAFNMCQFNQFVELIKTSPKSDSIVLVASFVLTVVFDLVIAIEIGMILASLLFIKRMSDETDVKAWEYVDKEEDLEENSLRLIPKYVRVYEISGPLFFGAADCILQISVKEYTKCLVLRLSSVSALDATALHSLKILFYKCRRKGISLIFSHVNEQPMNSLIKAGFVEMIGKENFCGHIDDALARAVQLGEGRKNDKE